jgi:hypothetical protein
LSRLRFRSSITTLAEAHIGAEICVVKVVYDNPSPNLKTGVPV